MEVEGNSEAQNDVQNEDKNNVRNEAKNELRLADCALRNLRMTTRVITQYYDKALQEAGLKSTQFSLLNVISYKEEGLSVNAIAEHARMDQTTVTRNIEILQKKGYINISTEEKDSRKKRVTISEVGKAKVALAMPLWEAAQLNVEQIVGAEKYKDLLQTLNILKKIK